MKTAAKHLKAAAYVRRQLFAGLASFEQLEARIAALPDEQSRGAAFEVFAEAYLATQRKYDAAQVWPHGSIPLDLLKNLGLTQQDQGVDGVKKVFTFHRDVKSAQSFVSDGPEGVGTHLAGVAADVRRLNLNFRPMRLDNMDDSKINLVNLGVRYKTRNV